MWLRSTRWIVPSRGSSPPATLCAGAERRGTRPGSWTRIARSFAPASPGAEPIGVILTFCALAGATARRNARVAPACAAFMPSSSGGCFEVCLVWRAALAWLALILSVFMCFELWLLVHPYLKLVPQGFDDLLNVCARLR